MSLTDTFYTTHPSPRRFPVTAERLNQIRNLIERGHSREEIADAVGLTVGSLSVLCSRHGIRFRQIRLANGIKPIRKKTRVKVQAQTIPGTLSITVRIGIATRTVTVPFDVCIDCVSNQATDNS